MWPSYNLNVRRRAALYFEAYGLEADPTGNARYTVRLTVENASRPGLFARILGRIVGQPDNQRPVTSLTWDRSARARPVLPELFTIEFPEVVPGYYLITVELTDRLSGEEAHRTRRVTLEP
jgi:hypothetical protein